MDKEISEVARKLYNTLQHLVIYLYGRWLDEHEYENINDYAVDIKKEVEKEGGIFLNMTKRPFGFNFMLGEALYRITCNSTTYKMERIK